MLAVESVTPSRSDSSVDPSRPSPAGSIDALEGLARSVVGIGDVPFAMASAEGGDASTGGAAAPAGPDGEPVYDEETEHVPGSFLESLPQFFVFPLILVITLTVIYVLLRALAGAETRSADELITEVRSMPESHARWQSLHSLADGLQRQRITLDGVSAATLAGFYEDLRDDGPMVRQFALNILAFKQDPALTPLALGALDDEDRDVRLGALYALTQLADPSAIDALAAVVASGRDHEEGFLAVGALARVDTPAARDAVASALGAGDSILHRNAVLVLAKSGDARGVALLPALLVRARYDEDSTLVSDPTLDEASAQIVRGIVTDEFLINACRAAEALGDPTLVGPLQALRTDDPSPKVRSAALNALHTLGADA